MAGKLATQKATEAFDTIVDFLESFESLDDPRQRGKVLYPLDEVLLLVLLGVIAGCESWVEIARYGEKKLALLRRFRPFKDETPSHDQLGDIFAVLDAEQFQTCFVAWVTSLTGLGPEIIAIDGKTLRRSYQEGGAKAPIHMVSAWSAGQNMVLGQVKVADKSNEITAIPRLLDMLTIKGAVVTIDAMGCQREIAAKIVEKEADYVLALKGNQGTLRDDVEEFFTEQKANKYTDCKPSFHQTLEKSHGRIETRTVTVVGDIDWLKERHGWAGLASIVRVECSREIAGKSERESRFYITSLPACAERIGLAIRGHWGIENGLHWVMDMVFRDDECRIRKNNAPANFATIKHMASNLLRQAPGKDSLRVKRKVAAWDDDYLATIIAKK
ncbi:MAG: ISAs1 family transposase [Hyphomicrobiaceae bacterium]